jgi:SAM-dependent methyltransferase
LAILLSPSRWRESAVEQGLRRPRPHLRRTPNALLASAILDRKPGKALDFGMGQGRNAVFLAMQGWDVTGFDPSDEGVRLAQANAAKAGVKIRALVSTDDQFDFGVAQWDLIAMTYVRSPAARDADRIRRALAPGGIFVYENGSDRHNELPETVSLVSHPALRRRGRLPGLESRRKNPPGALGGGEATG